MHALCIVAVYLHVVCNDYNLKVVIGVSNVCMQKIDFQEGPHCACVDKNAHRNKCLQ